MTPHPAPKTTDSPPGLDSPERQAALIRGIGQIYAAYNQALPDPISAPDRTAALLAGWAASLADIPTSRLDSAFNRALRNHKGSFLPVPSEVVAAWFYLVEEAQREPPPAPAGLLASGGRPPDFVIRDLVAVMGEWATEHHDPVAYTTRVAWAIAASRASMRAETIRGLLESVGCPTLYEALVALEVAVAPPPPLPPARSEGTYWQRVNPAHDPPDPGPMAPHSHPTYLAGLGGAERVTEPISYQGESPHEQV